MIVLRKARWPMFVIGLISIAIVGYGSAINQPWAAVFGPFSTTLGTMMCFAQWFVPFPVPPLSLQPTPVANRATQPLPHVKTIPQQSQQYSTSFTGPTYGTPNPMFAYGPQKRYIGSGIALWLCVLCLFCETIQYVSIVSIIQATLDAVSIVQNYAIFTILAD